MKKFQASLLNFFILLFLAASFFGCEKENKNTNPVAGFIISPQAGNYETAFTFDASGCTDNEDISSTLRVRWDWESDGIFDTDFSTNKILEHQFTHPDTFKITLEVIDSEDLGNSLTKSLVVTGMVPEVFTDTVSDITENSAICGGLVDADNGAQVTARGVCWGISPNPTVTGDHTSDGSGTGAFESNITGLNDNSLYYVRAYATNEIGTAYGEEKSFTTLKIWSCGDPLNIVHVEGNISPVDKSVTYGTVTNVPGEQDKCWITQNLGADHQAISVDDGSEASAGWYWQFNRKQGYMHDGIYRYPDTYWISDIDEDLEWVASNDPCSLELGPEWHVPTKTEWQNVLTSGEWNNLYDAWNSALKIHAAGYLMSENGALIHRGSDGTYWSNTQNPTADAWLLLLPADGSSVMYDLKSHCLTLRCVR